MTVAGIHSRKDEGAFSIALNAGYVDDEDYGDRIIYTGEGGNDPNTKRQVEDQTFTKGNLGLAKNVETGLPVRVLRGPKHKSPLPTPKGYRYDGLFSVVSCWHEEGRDGFLIYRYELRKLGEEESESWNDQDEDPPALPPGNAKPGTRKTTTNRIIRDTEMSRSVKRIHKHRCQVCALSLPGPVGPYAEGAHIRPLGGTHAGRDTPDNLLCLCPNHHVLFDLGAIGVADDLSLIGHDGVLRTKSKHSIDFDNVRYHRQHVLKAE